MTTGRINQVTIVSYTPAPCGARGRRYRDPRGPFAGGAVLSQGDFLFILSGLKRSTPRRGRPSGQPSPGGKAPQISPGPTNFRGTAGLPSQGGDATAPR